MAETFSFSTTAAENFDARGSEIFFSKETKKTRQDLNFSRLFQICFRFKIISSFQSFSHKFFARNTLFK